MKLSIGSLGYASVLLVGLVLAALVHFKTDRDYQSALGYYRQLSTNDAALAAQNTSDSLNQIYQGIRTIASLPSIKNIDRYGKNLSVDARESIMQIYTNINTNVMVSEIYIVPANLEPEQIDPTTGSLQTPIMMFDGYATVSPAGGIDTKSLVTTVEQAEHVDEVEIYEYRLLKEQMGYLKQSFPDSKDVANAGIPFISGSEVRTCDNHAYEKTKAETDRRGVVFSVPFYGMDGKFKGTVSAIVLTSALKNLFPEKDYALINQTHHYIAMSHNIGQETQSSKWVAQSKEDPSLLFSSVLPIASTDPQSQWSLWVGYPDSRFLSSKNMQAVRDFEYAGYAFSAFMTVIGMGFWWAVRKSAKSESGKKELDETKKRNFLQEMSESFEFSVKSMVSQVASSASKIQLDVQNVASIAEDTGRRSSLVARASVESIITSEQITASIEELTSSIKEISAQTRKSSQVANEAQTKAGTAKQTIEMLSNKSTKISEIIGTITGIAEKINLLALNATIESARAGEAGKGFAVVASEVKNLANLVAKATEEITTQIRDMQSVTKTSVDSVADILAIIDQVSSGTSAIAGAVEQQSSVTSEIAKNIFRSAEGTQSISQNIASVQEGAKQTEATANAVLESTKHLSSQSDVLKRKIDEFLATIRSA